MDEKRIQKERQKLEKMAYQLTRELEHTPRGKIRSEMNMGKYPQFYYIEEGSTDTRGKYLKKNDISIAREIVRNEYKREMLKCVKAQLKALTYIEQYHIDQFVRQRAEVIEMFSIAKRSLLLPMELTDEEFIAKWNETVLGEMNRIPIENGFLTERGEMVRSKSEKLIADKLYYRNIPYRYEPILKLGDDSMVCPDFAILSVRKRKTFYLEHFGMMDSPEYCKKALEKMELYEKNGLINSEDIFYTMESSQKAINMLAVDRIIERIV